MIKKKMLISGPCSAESQEQIEIVGKYLTENKVCDVFRAGIWKPRTTPNSFEGIGEKGLPWLRDFQIKYGIPAATEIALPRHVEACLKYDIKFLWIGARTTTSPFAVQDIADSLKGVSGVTVFIKNPINAELKLWIGAFERFIKIGQTNLGGIHRGFSGIENNIYRNLPMWQMAIDLKHELPDIPLVCDPSHICGKRDTIYSVSQHAMDLNLDGLMIEVHPDPDKALSDSGQQLTPSNFKKLIDSINFPMENSENNEISDQIEFLRAKIDRLDSELLSILKERYNVVEKIGELKNLENVSFFQPQRFNELIKERIELGEKAGLNSDFVSDLFRKIHFESLRVQAKRVQKKDCA